MAVEKAFWGDNFGLQSSLCLDSNKVLLKIKYGRIATTPNRMTLPLFFHDGLTMGKLAHAIAGELHTLQVFFHQTVTIVFFCVHISMLLSVLILIGFSSDSNCFIPLFQIVMRGFPKILENYFNMLLCEYRNDCSYIYTSFCF